MMTAETFQVADTATITSPLRVSFPGGQAISAAARGMAASLTGRNICESRF